MLQECQVNLEQWGQQGLLDYVEHQDLKVRLVGMVCLELEEDQGQLV